MKKKLFHNAKMSSAENVEYVLRDKNGYVKPIFVFHALGRLLMNIGVITPHAPKISFLLGFWMKKAAIANLITTAGKAGVASRLNGSGAEAAFTYIAIGTGIVAADAADTTLGTEIAANGGQRANSTASRATTDTTNDTARLVNTFTFTGSYAVTESGILNAGAAGTLLARQVFAAINVASGDSLQVTWDVDVD